MAQYVVMYGMHREHDRAERDQLQTELRNRCDWVWQLDDVWIVECQRSPSEITDALLKVGAIENDDEFIVLGLTGEGDYRNVKNGVIEEWLKIHMTRI